MKPGKIEVEVIGPPGCPILFRRTLVSNRFFKILLHEFLPKASDRDPHDHPRGFFTFVYRGDYIDVQPDGRWEWLRAPSFAFRRATHAHTTTVGPNGCKTLVIMGPLRRDWGFFRAGKWYPWRVYESLFDHGGFRCPDE